MLEAIVAVDNSWGIGNKGELLCRVRDDLRNFRSVTSGKTVILGSKTLATFPNGQPLKNRRNIILSRRDDYKVDGAEVAHSLDEALNMLGEDENAVVIGGDSIYKLFLPYCKRIYVTKFDITLPADAFFPNLDELGFKIESESEEFLSSPDDSPAGMNWKIVTYVK
jgi:dihydrofolate reductase